MGLLARIVVALEALAESARTGSGEAERLVADLEARMSAHVVAHQKAIADLQTRSPPEADLLKRIVSCEVLLGKQETQTNSLRAKLYRELPEKKARRAADDDMPPGVLGLNFGAPIVEESAGVEPPGDG